MPSSSGPEPPRRQLERSQQAPEASQEHALEPQERPRTPNWAPRGSHKQPRAIKTETKTCQDCVSDGKCRLPEKYTFFPRKNHTFSCPRAPKSHQNPFKMIPGLFQIPPKCSQNHSKCDFRRRQGPFGHYFGPLIEKSLILYAKKVVPRTRKCPGEVKKKRKSIEILKFFLVFLRCDFQGNSMCCARTAVL